MTTFWPKNKKGAVMTYSVTDGRQLKAGRVILGMSIRDMAQATGLNRNSILRVEAHENLPHHAHAADRMVKALEERGICFTANDCLLGVHFEGLSKRLRPKYIRGRPSA
jgi:hypothetical protein